MIQGSRKVTSLVSCYRYATQYGTLHAFSGGYLPVVVMVLVNFAHGVTFVAR